MAKMNGYSIIFNRNNEKGCFVMQKRVIIPVSTTELIICLSAILVFVLH